MWPQQMAWQRADLWKPAHRETCLCCGGIGRSAGQPDPWAGSFPPSSRTKETRRFTRSNGSQKVLHMPSEQNTKAFVKAETFLKSLLTKTRNIADEDVKGSSQLTSGITF